MYESLEYYDRKIKQDMEQKYKHWLQHWSLVKDLLDIAELWCQQHTWSYERRLERNVSVGYASDLGTIRGVALNLTLGENDSAEKDAAIFIDEYVEPIAERHGLDQFSRDDDGRAKVIDYIWTNKHHKKLLVRVWIENSTHCKIEGTGQFTEVTKIVCA